MSYSRLAVFFAAAAAVALAQDSRGTIIGRVLDPSGAVVAAAQVQVLNTETNTRVTSVTNADGNYEAPYLLSGTYAVSVELQGFKKAVRDGIEVRVSDRLAVDFKLEVGDVAESVTVTSETPLLDTSSASVGSVMDGRRATELPVAGGNTYQLARFLPGAAAASGGHSPGNPTMDLANSISVNGAGAGNNEVTLDGVSNTYRGSSTYSAPPQDMVEEFRMQTANYDATSGHSMGAVVNVSTKSGTNTLHGTAYLLDSRIRAVPWFSNRWLHDTRTGPITEEKRAQANPGWLYQRWGGTVNGPVVIPKVYDGHNRTFWSFGYEGMNVKRQATFTGTFPTPAQRTGDFSPLLRLGAQYQIYDPATIAPAPSGRFSRQPLPNNIVPASRIDPIARKIMGYYPEPNVPGTADGRQNYFQIVNETWNYKSLAGRVDHVFSERHRVFGRVSNSGFDQKITNFPSEAAGTENNPKGYRAALDDVYVFNPTLLLNLRYGLVKQVPLTFPLNRGFDLLSLGFRQDLLDEIKRKSNPAGLAFPQIAPDGYTALGSGGGSTTSVYYHNFGATMTKIAGNHSYRFGGEFRLMRDNSFNYGAVAPSLDFGPAWTRGPLDSSTAAPIGQGLASMLFGLPSGGSVSVNASNAEQSTFSAAFFQDDWKVSRRLTLNIGLRYEYETAVTERFNRSLRTFDFAAANPVDAEARANYAKSPIPEVPVSAFRSLGGLTFAGAGSQPRALWNPDSNNFAPRIGFAWQLNSKTVIGAGYGLFFGQMGVDRQHVNQGGFSLGTNVVPSLDNGLTFRATLANPFPDGIQTPPGASGGLLTNVGRAISFFNERPLSEYMQRWSFSLRRQLPLRSTIEVSYVGNRGTKLAVARQFNPVPAAYLSTSPVRDQRTIDMLSTQVTNPFSAIPVFAGTSLSGARVGRSQLLRPYPQFMNISTDLPDGYSYYHSMQTNVEKRFSHGLLFQAAWTWAKLMDATAYLNETDPRPYEVVSAIDVTHRFVASVIYELPFGKGKPVLGGAGAWLNRVVGGWQAQGVYEGQSGQPLSFGNIIFNGNLKDIELPVSRRDVDRWFNVDAGFDRDARNLLASNIRTFPLRFSGIRGDGINNFDLSMLKNIPIKEGVRGQFRMEAYNALNHVQLANPNLAPTNTAFGTITAEKGHGQRQINFVFKVLF